MNSSCAQCGDEMISVLTEDGFNLSSYLGGIELRTENNTILTVRETLISLFGSEMTSLIKNMKSDDVTLCRSCNYRLYRCYLAHRIFVLQSKPGGILSKIFSNTNSNTSDAIVTAEDSDSPASVQVLVHDNEDFGVMEIQEDNTLESDSPAIVIERTRTDETAVTINSDSEPTFSDLRDDDMQIKIVSVRHEPPVKKIKQESEDGVEARKERRRKRKRLFTQIKKRNQYQTQKHAHGEELNASSTLNVDQNSTKVKTEKRLPVSATLNGKIYRMRKCEVAVGHFETGQIRQLALRTSEHPMSAERVQVGHPEEQSEPSTSKTSTTVEQKGESSKRRSPVRMLSPKGRHVILYKCPDCPGTFGTNALLRTHISAEHKEIQPYQCPKCPKTFSSSSSCAFHVRLHDNYKPHKCQHCNFAFSQKSDLLRHVLGHADMRPHSCPECGEKFRGKHHCRFHMKRFHPESNREIISVKVSLEAVEELLTLKKHSPNNQPTS